MNHPLCQISNSFSSLDWKTITSILAIAISIITIFITRHYNQKTTRLAIQQRIFITVLEKAKDCNKVWENEPADEMNDTSPHFKVITEMVISSEIIDTSLTLFSKNYKSVIDDKPFYYYIFWKQLNVDLRGFFRERTPDIAKKVNSQDYDKQLYRLRKLFESHFP
jgi:hypothetical protein